MEANENWADAMKKILNKNVRKKSVVLGKGKTDSQIEAKSKLKPKLDFEIVSNTNELGEHKDKTEEESVIKKKKDNLSNKTKESLKQREQKRAWVYMGRKKPHITDRTKERALTRIATRGVVILFNGVRERQSTLNSKLKEAGKSERRREKATKSVTNSSFMKMLKGKAKSIPLGAEMKQEKSSKSEPTWKVLRDDFMTGGKCKDWDKEDSDADDYSGIKDDSENDSDD